jgi:transposase
LQRQQPRLDPKRLVFIDETSVSTTITRLYGRAPQGERLVQKVPHGNWKTITFIAALRHDRVTAPFVLEGPMTGEMFKAYTEQFLAPTLTRGDIVFMDNVSVHKVDGIEEAIEARGAIPFYLPAYSPDLNPIEQLFAKLKALLRKVASYTLKNSAFTVISLCKDHGAVAGLVGIEGGVVSGVFNLESLGVRAPSRRPRHDKRYHEARTFAADDRE